jgi:hypothetical protein
MFSHLEKKRLKARLAALGLPPDQLLASFMMGRETRLLVVFDPATLEIRAMVPPEDYVSLF